MEKEIEFISQGSNSVLGNFESGGRARVDDKFAKHLVEEAKVAKYFTAAAIKPAATPKAAAEPAKAAKPTMKLKAKSHK